MTNKIPTRGRSRRLADESGAVAVLYSILMLLFIGLLALTLDLSALRFDRRHSQSAADLASTAAALQLLANPDDASIPFGPAEACERAWAYVLQNTLETEIGGANTPPPCSEFESISCDPDSAVNNEHMVEGQAGPYVVQITWPVLDDSRLMEDRTEAGDGEECQRIGVTLGRNRGFIFAGVFDYVAEGSRAKAVARAEIEEGQEQAAALVVLDPWGCEIVTAGGGGKAGALHVFEDDLQGPGIIQVDSDARGCGKNKYVIDANGNATDIKAGTYDDDAVPGADLGADGKALVRNGVIFAYGLLDPQCTETSNDNDCVYENKDYNENRLRGGSTPGRPVAGKRTLRTLWEHPYNCNEAATYTHPYHLDIPTCPEYDAGAPTASSHVDNLVQAVSTATGPFEDAIDPGNKYYLVDGAKYWFERSNGLKNCDPTTWNEAGSTQFAAGENWWFQCDMSIAPGETLTIPGGNVVVKGKIDLKGALSINGSGGLGEDNWIYVEGDFEKTSGASIRLGNPSDDPTGPDHAGTFVYIAPAGRLNWAGGADTDPSSEVTWIAPYGGPFADLGLWSEYDNIAEKPEVLGGDVSNLRIDGIYYMPNALFRFTGSGAMQQQRAQFVSYRIQMRGNGALRMSPDSERSKATHKIVVALIR